MVGIMITQNQGDEIIFSRKLPSPGKEIEAISKIKALIPTAAKPERHTNYKAKI